VNVNPVAVATGFVAVGTTESVRSTTTDVATDKAALDAPMLLVAMTETLMYLPISESVNTYSEFVAEVILEYEPPDVDARCHWYEYEVGEPDHVPVDVVVKVSPVRAVPLNVGTAELDGAEAAR
jgi:hypothetical protein